MEASYHRHDISDNVWALLEPHLLRILVTEGTRADCKEAVHKQRHLVENCFLILKRRRGIATCYAKTSDAFIAAVHVRCIAIWAAIRA